MSADDDNQADQHHELADLSCVKNVILAGLTMVIL